MRTAASNSLPQLREGAELHFVHREHLQQAKAACHSGEDAALLFSSLPSTLLLSRSWDCPKVHTKHSLYEDWQALRNKLLPSLPTQWDGMKLIRSKIQSLPMQGREGGGHPRHPAAC